MDWKLLGKTPDDETPAPGEGRAAVRALAEAVARNRALQALDVRNCALDATCVLELAAGLAENTTLVGLKAGDGNAARCDAKMYLEVAEAVGDKRTRDRGHCWAEGGYREAAFEFRSRTSGGQCPGKPAAVVDFWSDFGRFCSKLDRNSSFVDRMTSGEAL